MRLKKYNGKQNQMAEANTINYAIVKNPLGDIMLAADATALIGLYFVGQKHFPRTSKSWTLNVKHPVLRQAAKELKEYFAGKRTRFSVPLRPSGTEFQEKVWRSIARIPHGKTMSYSGLAQRAGKPEAIRAAGTATGRNPIAIIIPCHRVMGKNGSLCGFAGGLERKRHLLELEKIDVKRA